MTELELETLATTVAAKLTQQPKEWLTPTDLKNEFDLSIARQGNLRSQKMIPYVKRGRYIRYKRSDINEWLESARVV